MKMGNLLQKYAQGLKQSKSLNKGTEIIAWSMELLLQTIRSEQETK